jgi:energy-coupling factor transport system ATP-binding protein
MITLTFEHVRFSYNYVTALHDVSLHITPGEQVGLIGANGAGKSTLARHLNGLLRPTGGRVLVGDHDTRKHSPAHLARSVGYVFQNPDQQIFKRTVRDEVAFGPEHLFPDPSQITAAVDAALAATQLTAWAEHHPHDLLPAQRKLVALAGVLAMNTPVVVLDEPSAGQDAHGVRLIGTIMDQLRAAGRTVILITHDIDFCAEQCERIVVLHGGRVLLDGTPEHVFTQTAKLAHSAVEPPQLIRLAERLALPPNIKIEPWLSAWEQRLAKGQ